MAERVGPWFNLPDCASLLEAIDNITQRSVRNVPTGVLDGLPQRISFCLEEGNISPEQAEAALQHLSSVRGQSKRQH